MSDPFLGARERMVREQIEARGVLDPLVLAAVRAVPRHLFVEPAHWPDAYEDRPLPIGFGQTISQPFIVAYMVEALGVAGKRVLEIGAGSGYQTAILSRVASEVWSVEAQPPLADRAARALREAGAANVHLRVGDGLRGWPEAAPFAGILLSAAVPEVPRGLLEQLGPGGRFIGPVGAGRLQRLVRVVRAPGGLEASDLIGVLFVEAQAPARVEPPPGPALPQ